MRTLLSRHTSLTLILLLAGSVVHAQGGLLSTSGASSIEGGSGGGLTPWATLSGYATGGEWSGSSFLTHTRTDDFDLTIGGVAGNIGNRLELSIARQHLDISHLGTSRNALSQTIIGSKLRLAGDVVYGQWPQLALGVQHKRHRNGEFIRSLGAESDRSTDVYLSGTRLFLDGLMGRNVLANLTLRSTEANQGGLLGFGNDRHGSDRSIQLEGSVGLFLDQQWLIGYEYRDKPGGLTGLGEEAWQNVFVSYFPNKSFSVLAAWVDLGSIAGTDDQRGWYLSLQATF